MHFELRIVNDEPVVMRVTEHGVFASTGFEAVTIGGIAEAQQVLSDLRNFVANLMSSIDINVGHAMLFGAGNFLNRAGIIMQDLSAGVRELEREAPTS